MATAAKPILDEDALTPAEVLASLPAEELLLASRETSRVYNGLVLAKAVVIVQTKLRCRFLNLLAHRMDIPTVTLYRWARGGPVSDKGMRHCLRELALTLEGL